MKIYISSSWKNRDDVRSLAVKLRSYGHEVYDFTDSGCRTTPEIPPEKFPEQFDPSKHVYSAYLDRAEWRNAVTENKRAIARSDLIILLLPCGVDSTADWAYGLGLGKKSCVVGHPKAGERSPVHLWADAMFPDAEDAVRWVSNPQGDNKQPQGKCECNEDHGCFVKDNLVYCRGCGKLEVGLAG